MNDPKLEAMSKDIKQKQISMIKDIVSKTCERIELLEKQRQQIQMHIKVLKSDLMDLMDGRLDRILERQSVNDEIKQVSLMSISKVGDNSNFWYASYKIKFLTEEGAVEVELNNSITKQHAKGTYQLKSGEVKML